MPSEKHLPTQFLIATPLMMEVLAPTKMRTATNRHRLVLLALLAVGLGIDIVVLVQPLFATADHQ
jgi:hypothetical protein